MKEHHKDFYLIILWQWGRSPVHDLALHTNTKCYGGCYLLEYFHRAQTLSSFSQLKRIQLLFTKRGNFLSLQLIVNGRKKKFELFMFLLFLVTILSCLVITCPEATKAGARQIRWMLQKSSKFVAEIQFGKLTAIFLYSNSYANPTKLPIV